ncbi:hypothetical protein QZH41_016613, partial [Actinostola sp. cb2023]
TMYQSLHRKPISKDNSTAERKLFELLEEDCSELKDTVCKLLHLYESFAKVARYYEMKEIDVKIIEDTPGKHPSRAVLDFVQSSKPNLLVSEFLTCMIKIGRNDVLEEIRKCL